MENKNWPEKARLKMIEKSEFYGDQQAYQYGFYDGYQYLMASASTLLTDFFNSRSDANKFLLAEEQEDLIKEFDEYCKTNEVRETPESTN